jgi:hypothetical protein
VEGIRDLRGRLERDYQARVWQFARGMDVWGNSTVVGLDLPLGGRIGPMTGHHVRYAKKTGPLGWFGPRISLLDFNAVEAELRVWLEAWLMDQESHRPQSDETSTHP